MKVLFVGGGNQKGLAPLVIAQGESLKKDGLNVEYFEIIGRGVFGYLSNLPRLHRSIKSFNPDIVHAHYSFSWFLCSLGNVKPVVVSLMGSDVLGGPLKRFLIKVFYLIFPQSVFISKSQSINSYFANYSLYTIPNGVDMDKFKPINQNECRQLLGWESDKLHLLFAANPSRPEKNFSLTKQAIALIEKENIELHFLSGVDHDKVPLMMNASNVVLLSSNWEGSPNVIKEAMACNRPAVTTNVGDVEWLFGNEDGYIIACSNPIDFSTKIMNALEFSVKHGNTTGRERIKKLNLDDESIAKKITEVYNFMLKS